MNRVRILTMLAIAVTAGSALAFATYSYVNAAPAASATQMETSPVVVAVTNLGLGAEVKQDDVKELPWPADSVPEGVFSKKEEVVGRGLLAPVVKNEPILTDKLAARDSGVGLPPVIPRGMRAVSVRVNEVIGVAGYVLPGTRVDVLATASPSEQREDTTSKLVLANVQVLAAGTRLEQGADKGEPMQVTVVTLLVSPEQSEKLTLASTEGKIQLALRNPLDDGAPETPGVRPAGLLGNRAIRPPAPVRTASRTPAPVAPPAPVVEQRFTIEIIRGDKRATEQVR